MLDDEKRKRLERLVLFLSNASDAYHDGREESMISDREYDKLLAELRQLEEETKIYLPLSPTIKIGDEPTSDKIPHVKPMLSLKDTKSIEELLYFLGEQEGVLSWKIDGISVILQYLDGKLISASTRGNGLIGKNIYENAINMCYVPETVDIKGRLVVRGEGCLPIKEFDVIKKTKQGEKYSNPRNLAAGIINTTTSPHILLRHMHFVAHSLVEIESYPFLLETRLQELRYLEDLGFRVVPHSPVLNFELKNEIEKYENSVSDYEYPTDGLVLSINNVDYGESLGATQKFPKHSMAFKWEDAVKPIKVTGMKWSVSKTGLITPVVLLEPTPMEGTIVKQANLHNLKNFEELKIGKGDILIVYKANKIIPAIEDNMTRSGTEKPPNICPDCGGETFVIETDRTKKLYCRQCGSP